jgi:hypothetical protein
MNQDLNAFNTNLFEEFSKTIKITGLDYEAMNVNDDFYIVFFVPKYSLLTEEVVVSSLSLLLTLGQQLERKFPVSLVLKVYFSCCKK